MVALRDHMLNNGVFLNIHWHTLLIIPPLIITKEQLTQDSEVLDRALEFTDQVIN